MCIAQTEEEIENIDCPGFIFGAWRRLRAAHAGRHTDHAAYTCCNAPTADRAACGDLASYLNRSASRADFCADASL